MRRKALYSLLAANITFWLIGCAHTPPPLVIHEPGEIVQVPVRIACTPPPDLLSPIAPNDALKFSDSGSATAGSSCLFSPAETALQALLWSLHTRIESWEAWSKECQ
jgi:hypothetical protein